MTIEGDIVDFINDINFAVDNGAPLGLSNAANRMHEEVMYTFRIEGPGWKPLSKITVAVKKRHRAPEPERILKEFDHMRKSIEVRDESEIKTGLVRRGTLVDTFQFNNYEFSVGLFGDTAFTDRVRRGILHEFGGFEKIERDIAPIEEIRTGRIKARALRGEQEVEKFGREVKKRKIGEKRKTKQVIRIPSRSFLRLPFDRIEKELLNIIENTINQVLEDVL